jgi:hypothetical protein
MTRQNAKGVKVGAATMAAVVLVGGLVAGGLVAMTTPTHMAQQGETWRDMIGVRKVAVEDGTIPVYAAPEDLSPVQWQTAAQEYPAVPPPNQWVDVSADAMPEAIPDSGDDYRQQDAVEALPTELMQARTSGTDLAALDDSAASSAEAARAAAADVRAQENTATADPAASSPADPQAASSST